MRPGVGWDAIGRPQSGDGRSIGSAAPRVRSPTRISGGGRNSRILFGQSGQPPSIKTTGRGSYLAPALYRRTDGIWRLAYEHDGQLEHEAWNNSDQLRVVMIFDLWNPLLSAADRELANKLAAATREYC